MHRLFSPIACTPVEEETRRLQCEGNSGSPTRRLPGNGFRLSAILSMIFILSAVVLHSQTRYFLAPNGNDRHPGTYGKPFATFARASEVLGPGDTLIVRGGVYREWFTLGGRDGERDRPIVIMARRGETPVIDGGGVMPTVDFAGLVNVSRRYYYISGLEIRNSKALGIRLLKTGGRASRLNVHDCWTSGIYAGGDSSIVEDCLVYNVNMSNLNGRAYLAGQDWGPGITAARGGDEPEKDNITDYAIIRRNICHDSWGEGISTYEARHTLLEDNVVYDAWAATFYISDAAYVVARRNLIYGTYAMPNRPGGLSRSVGLFIGNERWTPASQCDTIYGNIVYNTARCLYIAHPVPGSLLANNTFINSTAEANMRLSDPSSWTVVNNLVEQEGDLPIVSFGTAAGLSFAHNLWSKAPPKEATGPGDIIGNPKLTRSGSTKAGRLRWKFFTPGSTSPAIRAGINVGLPHSGDVPNIGAVQIGKLIGTLYQAPIPVAPDDGTTRVSTSPTFLWTSVPDATVYHLQVSLQEDFSGAVYDLNAVIDTSQTITFLARDALYYWRVSAGTGDNTSDWSPGSSFTTAPLDTPRQIPTAFSLFQNYPNPFNPSTTILYALPYRAFVTLMLFSIIGQRIVTLVHEEQDAGYHTLHLDMSNFASGIYAYRLEAGDFVRTMKLCLVR